MFPLKINLINLAFAKTFEYFTQFSILLGVSSFLQQECHLEKKNAIFNIISFFTLPKVKEKGCLNT